MALISPLRPKVVLRRLRLISLFHFKLGGRIQADFDQFDGVYTKNGKSANEAYFRRAILELSGTAYHDWKYAFNLDFAEDGSSKWDEASITYTGF